MAVKYAVLFLNICILFNLGNCGPKFRSRAQKYDAFDWKLFQAISNSSNTNIITSPFSVKVLLTITREAASGITRKEIQNALADLPKKLNGLSWFEDVISALEEKSKWYELSSATKVFLDKQLTLNNTFMETAQQYFHTSTQKVNFTNTKRAAKIINDWSSNNTNGIIKDLLTEDQLKDTLAVLTNAIYFKGKWEREFKKANTKKMPFHKSNGDIVNASMMYQHENAFYLETSELGDGAQLLRLPYKGGKFAITFVLPKKQNGLDKVIASIKPGLIGKLQKRFNNVKLSIYIPKFEFKSQFKLKDTLRALNIKQVFTNGANLPGFGPRQVVLSDVIQKAGIKIDEEGTEVAVASAAIFNKKTAIPREIIFKAAHPFAFFIEEESSGALLLAGKVFDPTA